MIRVVIHVWRGADPGSFVAEYRGVLGGYTADRGCPFGAVAAVLDALGVWDTRRGFVLPSEDRDPADDQPIDLVIEVLADCANRA